MENKRRPWFSFDRLKQKLLPEAYWLGQAHEDLTVHGISVEPGGMVRALALHFNSRMLDRSPEELYSSGLLIPFTFVWDMAMKVNDIVDARNPRDGVFLPSDDSSSFYEAMRTIPFGANGKTSTIALEFDKLWNSALVSKNIQGTVQPIVERMFSAIARREWQRPSMRAAYHDIALYREDINAINANAFIDILGSGIAYDQQEKARSVLVPFVQALCVIDDVAGWQSDLVGRQLPTWVAWAAQRSNRLEELMARDNHYRARFEEQGIPCPSGWQILQEFPEITTLLKSQLEGFLGQVAIHDPIFEMAKAGLRLMYRTYPPLYGTDRMQKMMGFEHKEGRVEIIPITARSMAPAI